MRRSILLLCAFLSLSCGPSTGVTGGHADLVDLTSLDPTFVIDIRYATANNFTGTVLYPAAKAKLRRVAAESLAAVQRELRSKGMGLKIYDGYRPLAIQWKLWEVVANPAFVADPRKGSKHNRGAAVDLTIVDAEGNEIDMPTGYDDFTEKASHDYADLPEHVLAHRALLLDVMTRHGFRPISSEWWHYDFEGWQQFDILDEPL